jgi:hypothetical protein
MSMTLNRGAYQRLIDEDVEELLAKMPRSLERDHIEQVLKQSVGLFYDEIPGGKRRWVDTFDNRT